MVIKSKFGGWVTGINWHQCPNETMTQGDVTYLGVKAYLDNVTYNPSDYTTTQVTNYAPPTTDKDLFTITGG